MIGARCRTGALGHFYCHRLADCAMFFEGVVFYVEQFML